MNINDDHPSVGKKEKFSGTPGKTICIPCNEEKYYEVSEDRKAFRNLLDELLEVHPEIFPIRMDEGYALFGSCPPSVKLGISLRRIRISATGEVYTIRPSFVFPYMTARTEEADKALFLRRFDVPYWGIAYVFGRNDMYWERLETGFGRNSIVGTTVKDPEQLPKDLSGDEKHTRLKGGKVYLATTGGDNCILGVSVCQSAGTDDLTDACGIFREEALNVDPEYSPETVSTDGWEATGKAWLNLFPGIAVIMCFLHAFMSIKRRCGKKFKDLLKKIGDKVWNAYIAETKKSFSQRIRRLREWADENLEEGAVLSKIHSLCNKKDSFLQAYDHPGARRTSNMIDRLMRWQDEYLFNRKYFHGSCESAELAIRSWAILRNFQPYCTRITGNKAELTSAAERLNGFRYSDNWLENLLVSASMGGYRQ
jgi:hypothetical protein